MVSPFRCMVTFLVTFATPCSAQSIYRPPADEKCVCSPVMNPVVNCGNHDIEELKTEMAAMAERIQQQQGDIQQLLGDRETQDQRIQALEQSSRTYIERCESGVLNTPHSALAYGNGMRYRDLTATFSKRFRTTPVVTIGFRKLDMDGSRNTRIEAGVYSKSPTRVTVRITTWTDSRVYVGGIYWMACA
ncbi:uncharacterized protein LOC144883366 [Branchiostoma floridae x Branchiostoma japonicum]